MMLNNLKYLFLVLALSLLLYGCRDGKVIDESQAEEIEELGEPESRIPEPPTINYRLVKIKNKKTLDSIITSLPDSVEKSVARKIIMTLNRKELRHIRNGESIIVPEVFTNNLLDYSIFPQFYPEAKSLKKIIIVSIDKQAYSCYERGKLVRFAATNSGKERTPSFPGRYALVWKERLRRSSLDSTWVMPFTFNFHSEAGSAFHKFNMPGRPVSHSCLRQFLDDAEWLFNWGEGIKKDSAGKWIYMSGTPVILLGYFDYSRPIGGPWLDFRSNEDGRVELPDKPMEVEEALIPIIQIPHSSRASLRNKQRYIYAEDTLRARGIIRSGVVLTPSVNFNVQRRLKKAAEEKRKLEEGQIRGSGEPAKIQNPNND